MLFDLRGGGRRRTIQAIYLGLAILMGGGLILFGIGGNVSGGLVDALSGNGGSSDNTFEKRVDRLEKRVQANPQDAQAWAQLARARYQATSTGDNYDQATSSFTPKGKRKLQEVSQAWQRYLSLDPAKPDPDVASLMVQVYGPSGLGQLDKAVEAEEIVANARPKQYALWAQLAQLAYAAGQTRKGDLSAEKAVSLAPKEQRKSLKSQLQSIKTQAAAQAVQQGAGAPTATTG
jgi:hypothetical protein